MKGLPSFRPTLPKPVSVDKKDVKSSPILESIYKVESTASYYIPVKAWSIA